MRFYIILFTRKSSTWALLFRCFKIFVRIHLHHLRPMYRPSHPPWFITLIIFGEAYMLWSSSLFSVIRPPATSSLFGPNILLRNLHILIYIILYSRREEKVLWTGLYQPFSNLICCLILSCVYFHLLPSFPDIWFISYFYVTNLSCILVTRREHASHSSLPTISDCNSKCSSMKQYRQTDRQVQPNDYEWQY
jgi:hypothetical protein